MTTPASTKPYNHGGRPRALSPRRRVIATRLTDDESRIVQEKIRATGLSRSEAIRLLLTYEPLPAKVFGGTDITATEAYRNLQPLQSNLNQIAHIFNSQRSSKISVEGARQTIGYIKSVEALVKELRTLVISTSVESAPQEVQS